MSSHMHCLFDAKEYQVLSDIQQILNIPHHCQELLAAEQTPTLAMAIPIYKILVVKWKCLVREIPELAHYINLGVGKVKEYVSMGCRNRIYALAMSTFFFWDTSFKYWHIILVINPRTKFKWMTEHWSVKECLNAEHWMEEAVRTILIIISQAANLLCIY